MEDHDECCSAGGHDVGARGQLCADTEQRCRMAKCHPRQEHLAVLRAGQPGADTAGNEHTGQFGGRVNRSVVARLGDPGGPVASYLAEPSIGGTTA